MWSTPKANCRQCDHGDFILDLNGTNRHDGDMSEFVG
ncbi:unnamed protein product [Rhodiola kirilowii]